MPIDFELEKSIVVSAQIATTDVEDKKEEAKIHGTIQNNEECYKKIELEDIVFMEEGNQVLEIEHLDDRQGSEVINQIPPTSVDEDSILGRHNKFVTILMKVWKELQ